MNNTSPLPAGITPPTWWERVFPEWMIDALVGTKDFLHENILWVVLLGAVILVIKFWYDAERKKFLQIKKLWTFTLFFLSKRLMMIPLIITFSRRGGELSNKKVEQLLQLRNECRSVSLRNDPEERLKRKATYSSALFEFFMELESKGTLQSSPSLQQLAKDLEFIDQKLVELQMAYNHEARRWNMQRHVFKKMLGLPALSLFQK